MTRAELLERVSSAELTHWQAYEQVAGPLGSERDDANAAMTAFYVLQGLGSKKVKLEKLLPKWDRKPAQKWQHMKMMAQAMTKQFGGTFTSPDSTS